MNRLPKTNSVGLLLILMSGLLPISALAESAPPRGPIPFTAFDQDGNGLVSEDEFYTVRGARMAERAAEDRPMYGAADAPSFPAFDTDGDGQLTPAELSAGQRAQMEYRRMTGKAHGMDRSMELDRSRNKPAFADFDLNGDGGVDAQEFEEAHAKRMAERSQQGYPMKNRANAPSFDELDSDGNGTVSTEEFSARKAQRQQ
ncbi:MAG: EF-hand domain-containing protein [Pseudomonadota bacterium]